MNLTRVGIVGGGRGGLAMLRLLSSLSEVSVVGIADVNSDAPGLVAARELGIQTFLDFTQLLKVPNLDVVVDVTGNASVNAAIMSNKAENTHLADAMISKLMYTIARSQEETAQELRAQAQQLAGMAEELNTTVQSVPEAIDTVTKILGSHSHKLNEAVSQAEKHIKDTDEVIDFIKKVADQTKLLGLNAAIEAARAGESGRGFGVVAEEVKKLANHSEQSVKEISAMITLTKQNTIAVNDSIAQTTSAMQSAASEASEVVSRFGDIMSAINASIQQVQEIAQQIDALTQTAGQIGAASEDVANSATSLAQMGLRDY